MKFPQLVVDQKEYEKHLVDLLNDPECLLLFDTNILSQMFSLHADARTEFAAWLTSCKTSHGQHRVVLPAWCLHEYTNKVVRDRLRDYIPVGTSIGNTTAYSKELMRHLAMSVDDKLAKSRNYATREDYLRELTQTHEAFIKLLPKPDNDEKTIHAIHAEISAMFGDSVAKSDIFALLKNCQADYDMRFENNLPPGFLDAHKDKNKLGDYIIWREILELAQQEKARAFVYVSNDGKKDWVYTPPKVRLPSGEAVENTAKRNGSVIQLLDPRLEYEASLAAGEEVDITLIRFEQLVRLLTRQDELAFRQLAEAVQSKTERKVRQPLPVVETPAEPAEEVLPITEVQPVGNDSNQHHIDPATIDVTTPVPTAEQPLFLYAAAALADATYEAPPTEVGVIIYKLKSHNWHTQNDGIGELKPHKLNAASADELFVLGRNILQAAMGSSFQAERYIENILYYSTSLDVTTAQHLFNGMLYEVYFDGNNEFRGSNGKAYYNEVFSNAIKNDHYLRPCAQFIQRQLQPFEDFVLFIPFVKEHRHEVVLSFRTPPTKDFCDSILEKCLIDNEDISSIIIGRVKQANHGRLRALGAYNNDLKHLMQAVCFSRYLPFKDDYVDMICKLDGEPVSEEELGDYIISSGLMV